MSRPVWPELSSNILLNIPDVTATNVTVAIGPIVNFDLGGGGFTGISVANAAIPTGGFQLSGLGLVSASIGNVGIPQTLVDNLRIEDFSPNGNIVVPNAQLSQLQLPLASAGDIQSVAPIEIHAQATSRVRYLGSVHDDGRPVPRTGKDQQDRS